QLRCGRPPAAHENPRLLRASCRRIRQPTGTAPFVFRPQRIYIRAMGPGAGRPAPPVASRGEIEALVETLGRELDEIAATLADTVHEHLVELEDDMRPWTLQAARSNLGVIVTMMREGDDPGSVHPPPEAIGYAKEYVVRGLELSLMQRAYRTAQGVFGGI